MCKFENAVPACRELRHRTQELARHLRRLGVGPEVQVSVWTEGTADTAVGLLDMLEAGGACL